MTVFSSVHGICVELAALAQQWAEKEISECCLNGDQIREELGRDLNEQEITLLSLSRAFGPTPAFAHPMAAEFTMRRMWPDGNSQGLRHTWEDMAIRLVTYNDSHDDSVVVRLLPFKLDGIPLVMATLISKPGYGYIAEDTGDGSFGDKICPSSYGMPCVAWFGLGGKYPDPFALLEAIGATCRSS